MAKSRTNWRKVTEALTTDLSWAIEWLVYEKPAGTIGYSPIQVNAWEARRDELLTRLIDAQEALDGKGK